MSVKGPGFDPQYCLFRNLCSKLVNCHHLTTPLINQCQNFRYGATSDFGWCVLQDLKHLNLDYYAEGQACLVRPLGKVKCFDTMHPSVRCRHSIVDKWQTLESCKTPYSSVDEHSPCLWKVLGSIPSIVSLEIYVLHLSTATILPPPLIINVKISGMVPHQSSDDVYCRTWKTLIWNHYGRRTSLPSVAPW